MDHNGLADPYVKLHLLPGASKVRRLSLPSPFPGISLGNLVMVPRWAAVSPGAAGASPRDRGSLGAAVPPRRPTDQAHKVLGQLQAWGETSSGFVWWFGFPSPVAFKTPQIPIKQGINRKGNISIYLSSALAGEKSN